MSVSEQELQEVVADGAERLEVPGVAVGVYAGGQEQYAFHGVTSIENPLPVDEDTLFQFGSTGKTFTATTIMRLVDQGKLDLDAPVRDYVPELRLKDASVAEAVTVLQLLNHTAGWQGDLMDDTGEGDDALTRYVERMADLEQETPLGATVSYNNAALSLAGRVVEKLTGQTYEQAVRELIFDPLGLKHSFFFMTEIMTRRFAVGHNQRPDGTINVARPWAMSRGGAPAGGISANAGDLVAWGRFHLGDGTAADGSPILAEELLRRMQEPTVDMSGSALGDAVGISWLLRDVDGVRLVGHGGTTNGQHSEFVMVPERDVVISIMTNCGPNGPQLQDELVRWALEAYAGVVDVEPEAVPASPEQLAEYAGRYETIAVTLDVTPDDGGLLLQVEVKPEVREQLREAGEPDDFDQPPYPVGLLPGDGDRYVVTEGPAKGMTGYFVRDEGGRITGVHVGGRLATRSPAAVG